MPRFDSSWRRCFGKLFDSFALSWVGKTLRPKQVERPEHAISVVHLWGREGLLLARYLQLSEKHFDHKGPSDLPPFPSPQLRSRQTCQGHRVHDNNRDNSHVEWLIIMEANRPIRTLGFPPSWFILWADYRPRNKAPLPSEGAHRTPLHGKVAQAELMRSWDNYSSMLLWACEANGQIADLCMLIHVCSLAVFSKFCKLHSSEG